MSTTRFLPWMRTGLASTIPALALSGDQPAAIPTNLDVIADGTTHAVSGPEILMRGPGDVIAFNAAEIKRRDPEQGATGAETNYFCSVEFFSPDLPWRYTPIGAGDDDQLQPWLALVVVELGSGVTLSTAGRLTTLHVDSPDEHLPNLDDAWAWAHVQVATTVDKFDVAAAHSTDPSSFSSRLLCPRRLNADTAYTACLVPTFEAGRLAGLGNPGSTSLAPAWTTAKAELPVYDSWVLTAGDRFDFKTLALRIEPEEVPDDVGFRDLDLTDAGAGMTPISSPATFVGAMHAPTEGLQYWAKDAARQTFEADVRMRLDTTGGDDDPGKGYDPLVHDPVVAPSLYGAPQVGTTTLPPVDVVPKRPTLAPRPPTTLQLNRPVGWFEELNIGPHHRSVAGLGAEVIRADQESLMAAAWEQARPAIEVNRILNRGRLSEEAAVQSQRKFAAVDDATAVSIAAPALVRMRVNGSTARRVVADGDAPLAYFGSAFRRLGRPNGPLSMPIAIAAGRTPAWAIADAVVQSAKPGAALFDSPLSIGYRTRYLPAGMDVGVELITDGTIIDGPVGHLPGQLLERERRVDVRRKTRAAPAVPLSEVAAKPVRERLDVATPAPLIASGDFVVDAVAVTDFQYEIIRPATTGRIVTSSVEAPVVGLDIAATVRATVQPALAVVDSVKSLLAVPSETWDAPSIPTHVGLEPRFTDPMYERVRALSVDYLVPGVGSVRNNTLGLLELNAAYVEAFLVGLNHEMSREMRWREYPAALGQTWFQHFFDNVGETAPADIDPIEGWSPDDSLGSHFLASPGAVDSAEPGLVLLMKADLLRKYPDVRVYAIPATMVGGERVPDETASTVGPSMVGTLQRGVNFYGFPTLTEQDARGDDAGEHGWFFVLEEEPRTMRFGLDRSTAARKGKEPVGKTWANLEWPNLANAGEDVPMFCSIDTPNPKIETAAYDGLAWGDDAAVMAAITFRQPIQVFMHASAMLPEPGEG